MSDMKKDVLDKGYVKLRDKMGNDFTPADAARVSFDKRADQFSDERNRSLINYLFKNKEFACVRHNVVSFEMYMPLMVARQLFKYSIGSSFREDSAGWNESCLPEDAPIWSYGPEQYTVKDLLKNKNIPLRSINDNGEIVPNRVKAIWKTGNFEVFEVVDELGNKTFTTKTHRFLTKDGYVELEKLNVGDYIANMCDVSKQTIGDSKRPVVAGFSKIESIKSVGFKDVYDIEMELEPNFVSGGIILHNSRRYLTDEPEFYIPAENQWRSAPESKKQGSGEPIDSETGDQYTNELINYVNKGIDLYNQAISDGVAVEQARLLLPAYGMYVRVYWTASLNSIFHMLNERLEHNAQYEIQQYARAISDIIQQQFPIIYQAWQDNK